jgi:hypothetical protein
MHPTFGMELFVWLLIIVVIPIGVAVFFGTIQFRKMEKLVFHCQKCGEMFRQKAHLPFPKACPHCHATNWSVNDEHAAPRIGG